MNGSTTGSVSGEIGDDEKPPPRACLPAGHCAVAVACARGAAAEVEVALASVTVSFRFFFFLVSTAFGAFFFTATLRLRQSTLAKTGRSGPVPSRRADTCQAFAAPRRDS